MCVRDRLQADQRHQEPMCRSPSRGDLVITEVLPAGDPTAMAECVAVVKRCRVAIDLAGVSILTQRNGRLIGLVLFGYGCLPPKATMALFSDRNDWLIMPAPVEPLVASTKRFGFSNERDFRVLLEGHDGEILDSIQGLGALIEPGVSLGRAKPELHVSLQKHTEIGLGRPKSPGLCPTGGTYSESCAAGESDVICLKPVN